VHSPQRFADALLKWAHEELGDGERERENIHKCVCVCVASCLCSNNMKKCLKQGVYHTMALPFYIKKYLKAKEEL
jgi:hypothetical protein